MKLGLIKTIFSLTAPDNDNTDESLIEKDKIKNQENQHNQIEVKQLRQPQQQQLNLETKKPDSTKKLTVKDPDKCVFENHPLYPHCVSKVAVI